MWCYKLGAGVGHGKYRITAFDDALLEAGVGNYNLVRLSSILPMWSHKKSNIQLEYGELLPTAYARLSTNVEGTPVASAVAIGFPVLSENGEERCGVIMEYSDYCEVGEAEEVVKDMVREAFHIRGWELDHIESVSSGAVCGKDECCVSFACVAQWKE